MQRLFALFLAVLAGVTLVASPSPATASAAGQIKINWSNSDSADLGRLRISVTSTLPIAALKAHIIASDGTELATADDFALTSGTTVNGVWTTVSRIQIGRLGFFRVDVEATDTEGTHVRTDRAGNLSYYVATVFEPLRSTPSAVKYDRREVTVKGRLLGRHPGTGQLTSFAGAPVSLSIAFRNRIGGYDGFANAEVTTDDRGRFEYTRTLPQGTEFTATYPQNNAFPGYLRGTSDRLVVLVDPARTQVKVDTDTAQIAEGSAVRISGLARWRSPDDGWQPLAGSRLVVFVDYGASGSGSPESVTTGPDGRYSIDLTLYRSGTVIVNFPSDDPFKADARETVAVTVLHPAAFTEFTAGRAGANVNVSGEIDYPGNTSAYSAEFAVEFSADGRTWTRRALLPGEQAGRGFSFTTSIPETAAGYWRATYSGAPHFQDAASPAVAVSAVP
ncbi:hypothetical protein [Herbidospora sp. RD11066]